MDGKLRNKIIWILEDVQGMVKASSQERIKIDEALDALKKNCWEVKQFSVEFDQYDLEKFGTDLLVNPLGLCSEIFGDIPDPYLSQYFSEDEAKKIFDNYKEVSDEDLLNVSNLSLYVIQLVSPEGEIEGEKTVLLN